MRRRPHWTVWALAGALVLLTAVACGCSPPAPDPTPTSERLKLGPGEVIRTTMEPVAKPTEADPRVVVHLTVTDEKTGEPVTAAFVEVNQKVVAIKVQEVKIVLPGQLTERTSIEVAAPGYEPWGIEVRWKYDYSRVWQLPVRLKPVDEANANDEA